LSTGQLIVTIAFVGLLGAFHLVLRGARAPAGAAAVAAPRPAARRVPLMALLVFAAFAALAFAGVAFVVSVLDNEDTTAPATQATTTARATTEAPPPPSSPPVPPLEAPRGTESVASVLVTADGLLADTRNRVGAAPSVVEREEGVYTVEVPGLTAALRRKAVIRTRAANGASGVMVSARKMGPGAEFVVFTRDGQTRAFKETGFEFAVFLPQQELEGTAGDEEDGRPVLPPTR
jgi:hypothetical protein